MLLSKQMKIVIADSYFLHLKSSTKLVLVGKEMKTLIAIHTCYNYEFSTNLQSWKLLAFL